MFLIAILKGWFYYLFPSAKVELEARRRAKICKSCERRKRLKYEIIKDNRIQELTGWCCGICSCPLSTLLRQNEKGCQAGKWHVKK